MKAPAILFCNNNQWPSRPRSARRPRRPLSRTRRSARMPGVRVDGGDVLAVYEATRGNERARSGQGPTFIEAGVCAARTRPLTIRRSTLTRSAFRRNARTNVGRYERYLERAGFPTSADADDPQRGAAVMREGIARAEGACGHLARVRARRCAATIAVSDLEELEDPDDEMLVEAVNDDFTSRWNATLRSSSRARTSPPAEFFATAGRLGPIRCGPLRRYAARGRRIVEPQSTVRWAGARSARCSTTPSAIRRPTS